MNIERGRVPALLPWLQHALVGVTVIPPADKGGVWTDGRWRIELNNGLGGHDGLGTIIASCGSELEAELVAAALWRLVTS